MVIVANNDRYHRLVDLLRQKGRLAVAFSGGVDSTLVLAAAREAAGADVIALFARSRLQKEIVVQRVVSSCRQMGVTLRMVEIDPFSWPGFVANGDNRCYLCKKGIYATFLALLAKGTVLLDGTNVDDLCRHRPGLQAVRELGVWMPLVEAGLGKEEIRAVSRAMGLASWNLPSESCLATRIITGCTLEPRLLDLVEAAEAFLEGHGFAGCRVRLDGSAVFVTVPAGHQRARLAAPPLRLELANILAKGDYAKVFLDLSE